MSHVIKNVFTVIYLLLCSKYMKKTLMQTRDCLGSEWIPSPTSAWSHLVTGWKWIWPDWCLTPSSLCCRGLCPAASESTAEQTPLWLSLWKGKRSSLWHAVSTLLGTLLKPAGPFLFWILLEVCESNLPPVGPWVCKHFVVTLARQRSQCFEPKTENCSKWQVTFCLPTLSLVLPVCLPSAWYRVPEMERE